MQPPQNKIEIGLFPPVLEHHCGGSDVEILNFQRSQLPILPNYESEKKKIGAFSRN